MVPAIQLAEDGAGVTPRLRISILTNRERFLKFPSSKAAFLEPDGSAPEIATVRRQPDLARTLRRIAEEGPRAFYEGDIAARIVQSVQQSPVRPGRLSMGDLAAYRAVYRLPVRFRYRGYEVVGMPPPSSGTLTLGLMLGLLESTDPAARRPGTVEEIDLLARAESVAFADRDAYLGDQDWSDIAMTSLLDPARIGLRAEALRQAKPGQRVDPGPFPGTGTPPVSAAGGLNEGTDTTHFSVVDADRNVVACTTTIEHGMGSGLVVGGAGFLLNNELTDFDLRRTEGPNALDASRRVRRTALTHNDQPSGKRPRSSMTPVIVLKDGRPYLTFGSPGGSYIIGVVAQGLLGVLDHGLDVQTAINAPRCSSRNTGTLEMEALYGNRTALAAALQARGWTVPPRLPRYEAWGGAQGIRLLPDGTLEGGADPRREGAARGW
jgi:gamma-glutamyltranspeptidase/glutathione hydrolase